MAIIQYGPTVTGIRGTIGGITFSQNRTANYAKAWSRGPYGRSVTQNLTRSRMISNSLLWAELTQTARDDWNLFADNPNELDYDPWSAQRFLSGFQWFCRAQQRRSSLNLPNPGDVPSGAAETTVAGFAVYIEGNPAGASNVSYDASQFTSDEAIIVYLTFAAGTGAADAFRNWKLVYALKDPGDGPLDIHAAYQAIFGSPTTGWKAFAIAYKQALAGNRSIGTTANCIVV